eukprot:977502-Prymnesium_polylepis.1
MLERIVIRPTPSRDVCEAAVRAALRPDAVWRTARHDDSPTTDMELDGDGCDDVLRSLDEHLADGVLDDLFADLARAFGVQATELYLRELFVVKYEAGRQRELRTHRDASFFSFVLQLNEPAAFAGGGTTFAHAPACAPLT